MTIIETACKEKIMYGIPVYVYKDGVCLCENDMIQLARWWFFLVFLVFLGIVFIELLPDVPLDGRKRLKFCRLSMYNLKTDRPSYKSPYYVCIRKPLRVS